MFAFKYLTASGHVQSLMCYGRDNMSDIGTSLSSVAGLSFGHHSLSLVSNRPWSIGVVRAPIGMIDGGLEAGR